MNPTPEQIKETRELAGLTQAQAAALINCGDRTWRFWEAGTWPMSEGDWVLFYIKARRPELYEEVTKP